MSVAAVVEDHIIAPYCCSCSFAGRKGFVNALECLETVCRVSLESLRANCRESVVGLQGELRCILRCSVASASARQKNASARPCQRQKQWHRPWALTMSQRTEEQLRRRANNARRRYTSKRLSSLKQRFPLMPPDVLERATLRQVSVAVRRIGDGQSALSAFKPGESSSGSISNTLALDSD